MSELSFELTLSGGQAALRDNRTGSPIRLGEQDRHTYDNAQRAVELAVEAICAVTGRMNRDAADEKAFAQALQNGAVTLTVRGHARECRVVALHLHARYGLDFDRICSGTPRAGGQAGVQPGVQAGVRIDALPDADDGYAMYRFDEDLRRVTKTRSLVERWQALCKRHPQASERLARSLERWQELLPLSDGKVAPVRIVVTGVTGAGKSTFLNAVLGRQIVPDSSGVCTATVLKIRKAKSSAHEGFEIKWRSRGEIEDHIEILVGKQRRIATAAKADAWMNSPLSQIKENLQSVDDKSKDLTSKILALRAAAAEAKAPQRLRQLKSIGHYAKAAPDSCAEAVSELVVRLDHPLLEFVEFVDAPGLRDGDDQRQKLLIRAFEGDAAWLYLAPAPSRDNSCVEDWTHIQALAHNDMGVLLLTKADAQPPDRGQTTSDAMVRRMHDYRDFGWTRAIEWCSAWLPAKLTALEGGEFEDGSIELSCLRSCLNLRGREPERRLQDFAYDRRGQPESWATFQDYALDASRVPAILRRLGRSLFEETMARRIEEVHKDLLESVQEAIANIDTAGTRAAQILNAHDLMQHQRMELQKSQSELLAIENERTLLLEHHAAALDKADESARDLTSRFESLIASQRASLRNAFDATFETQSKDIWFWGDRSFPLVAEFEQPLTRAAHDYLKEHVDALTLAAGSEQRSKLEGLLRNYVLMDDLESGGDVAHKEEILDSKRTVRDRMWNKTSARANRFAEGLTNGFAARLEKIRDRLEKSQKQDRGPYEDRISDHKRYISDLEAALADHNPGQSRENAQRELVQLADHRVLFEQFLAEINGGPRAT